MSQCHNCSKKIEGKPWLHLYKTTDTFFCSYGCCSRSNISGYWNYIVNKEDYKDIINPYMFVKKVDLEFYFLTPIEIENLGDRERIDYEKQYEEYFMINPERAYEEYSQMVEDYEIEQMEESGKFSSDEDDFMDDY